MRDAVGGSEPVFIQPESIAQAVTGFTETVAAVVGVMSWRSGSLSLRKQDEGDWMCVRKVPRTGAFMMTQSPFFSLFSSFGVEVAGSKVGFCVDGA